MFNTVKNQFNKIIVSVYKVMGFVVLTAIMFGIVTYLGTSVFYLLDRDWVVPVVLSPSSEKVLQMNSHLIQQNYQREQLHVERMSLEAELAIIEESTVVGNQMLERYEAAIDVELNARQHERGALKSLYGEYVAARPAMEENTALMAEMTERNVEEELAAGLISEESYIRGKSLVSSNLASWVSYAQKEVEFDTKMGALDREVDALAAVRDELDGQIAAGDNAALSVDVLSLLKDYNRTRLEVMGQESKRIPIQRQMAAIDSSIEDYEAIRETIEQSPYYYALHEDVTVAFVPYDNLHNMEVGDRVYGCTLELVWCREVGTISQVLDGEVQTRHPLFKTEMRGLMVHIELDDEKWSEEKALHANGRPLFI